MMTDALLALIGSSLVMAAVAAGLALFQAVFGRRYSARWGYLLWLIVLVGLLVPFRPDTGVALLRLPAPTMLETAAFAPEPPAAERGAMETAAAIQAAAARADAPLRASQRASMTWAQALVLLWLAGALVFCALHLLRHRRFVRHVRRWSQPVTDPAALAAARRARESLRMHRPLPALRRCRAVNRPMLTGLLRPAILLPEAVMLPDELELVLRHELVHYARRDLWMKAALLLIAAIHWFNPLLWWLPGAVEAACEAACDEAVLASEGRERRRQYGELIIGVASQRQRRQTLLTTCFLGGKNEVKKRLETIFGTQPKHNALAVLCAVVLAATGLLGQAVFAETTAVPAPPAPPASLGTPVTLRRAIEIALEKVGEGFVTKAELDWEKEQSVFGVEILDWEKEQAVFEVEILVGQTAHELEIAFADGQILRHEQEQERDVDLEDVPAAGDIGYAAAIEAALKEVPGGDIISLETELVGGVRAYEAELYHGTTKHEVVVRLSDGQVLRHQEAAHKVPSKEEVPQMEEMPEMKIMPEMEEKSGKD